MSASATSLTQSGKRRIVRCHTCATHFAETRETVFCDLRTSEAKVMMALKMLLVRVALAGIGFGRGVTEETVWAWLPRAAQPAEAINHPLLRHLPVPQGQLDEMWHCLGRQHARETAEAGERLPDSEEGRQGVWVSFAPELRLMSTAIGGPRTLDTAQEGGAVTKARVAGSPAFFSDGCTCSRAALLAACHGVTPFARTGKRGRPRQPLCQPHPDLGYGPLGTQKPQGKLVTLSTRIVLGAERLTHLGCTISTAVVERVNLTLRQALAPLARQTSSVWKDRECLRQRVVFFQAFSHVARPHMSLRQPVPLPARTRRGAICPRCQKRTPAMAAGLTDHVWTFRALLPAKCEPLDSQSISG